jgi:light-regulated signal transduction histidine kinase (bacteriophytochrome)
MPIDPQDLDAYSDSMQQLYDLLMASYDSAPTDEAKDAIYDLASTVDDILTTLNQEGLAEDDAQLKELQASVTEVNDQMKKAQAQVNQWVKDIGVAAAIAGLMGKAVELAAKVVGAP